MHVFERAETGARDVETFEDSEHLQRRDALTVGRQFPHVVAAVIQRHRLDPLAGVLSQVFVAEESAVRLHVGVDAPRDLALVERIAPFLGEQLERRGEARIGEQLAFARRAAARQERLGEARERLQLHFADRPVVRDEFGNRRAFLGVADRGCEHTRHRQLPESRVECEPAIDAAGDRHGQRPQRRQPRDAAPLQLSERERRGRTSAAVVSRELARLGIPHERVEIAAEPAARRLEQRLHSIGRDRRIHGATAVFQHLDRRERRERNARRRHAVPRDHFRARGEALPRDAIARQSERRNSQCRSEHVPQDTPSKGLRRPKPAKISDARPQCGRWKPTCCRRCSTRRTISANNASGWIGLVR